MNLNKLTINNYKSFGNDRNILYLNQFVTAIIGKNESGKSNILDAVGNLPYLGKPNKSYYSNKNRAASGIEKISIVLDLQLNEKEIKQYSVKDTNTELLFTNESTISIKGGLSEIIAQDNSLLARIEEIVITKGNTKIWNIGNNEPIRKRHTYILDNLKEISSIILLNFKQVINTLKQQVNRSHDKHKELINTLDEISSILSSYYSLLPRIFYREQDLQLEYSYDFEKVKEILKHKNDIFYRLLIAAGINEEEMIRAFEEKVEGDKQNIRDEIEEKIIRNIGERFNDFYTQETVKIKPRFEGNTIKFRVNTNNGKTMLITERSNGLRWYLSLFIDILANDFGDSPVIFLFDEPGVHLHVNAQKELLDLFNHLSHKGHKVIYTTHSPSMIDGENILNIRVVEKNDTGNTVIFNNCYDQRLSSESKMETLSPLLKAIGSDLKFNLGPQVSKDNILTEGITDYMYLKAMLHHFQVKEPPNIIPVAGVENINRIVSILMGWGCDYKILLDYDNAGRKEYSVLVEKLDPSLKEHITFVNGGNEPSLEDMKTAPITIENLISENDFNKLNNKLNRKKDNKVLVAKEFYDKIVSGQIEPEQQTIEAFEKILKKLNVPIGKNIFLEV
ncbi:AAA family ATPase [Virgibacillus sp. C22-A2]|uniref:AAA family ATPase n=1 Tax=Virgibacillus tibetensis TaxID=3042313 RepID=A0ABU6KGI1_9BACI|nr:AAA family ATPase [Virgibacillus sp. C22-A2]